MAILTTLKTFVSRFLDTPVPVREGCRQVVAGELEDDDPDDALPPTSSRPSLTHLKAGDVLQSTTMECMQAVIDEEVQPGFYAWHLAKPDHKGGFEPYGFVRYSEIDAEMWKPRK